MKLALICSGGGMRCAYSGGALVALAKQFHLTTPDIVIGISGGAASLTYYVSRQYDAIEHIWTTLVATPKFISFRLHRPILDIDYLVDTVIKKESPLDVGAFNSSRTNWYFPAADVSAHKQTRFFSKEDSLDIFELLRASMAVPLIYGKKVLLKKIGYQDGDLGLTIQDAIKQAQRLEATHIVVIESHPETLRVRLVDVFYKRWFFSIRARTQKQSAEVPIQNILRIQSTHSPAGLLTRNPKRLRAAFDKGYADTVNHPDLQKFLSPFQLKPDYNSPIQNP